MYRVVLVTKIPRKEGIDRAKLPKRVNTYNELHRSHDLQYQWKVSADYAIAINLPCIAELSEEITALEIATLYLCIYISDVFEFDAKFPMTPVPDVETTYTCMTVEFPTDQEYHIIGTEPILDNTEIMHHTLVYACEDSE